MFGLQEGHLAMLLSILMTQEMHRMQFVEWMVRMVGGLNFLTVLEVEVEAEDVEEDAGAPVVALI